MFIVRSFLKHLSLNIRRHINFEDNMLVNIQSIYNIRLYREYLSISHIF